MPFGNIEAPVNPISLALAAGATFVARGFSGEQKHLTELIKQGIEHEGFSFLDVFSPCVTYNHDNTYQWFRPRVKKLEDDSSYDSSDWTAATERSLLWGEEIPIGKFFERTDVPHCTRLSRCSTKGRSCVMSLACQPTWRARSSKS